jgi:hypothetical protein
MAEDDGAPARWQDELYDLLRRNEGGHFPLLTLVSMRGDFGEGNPWQFPMGQVRRPSGATWTPAPAAIASGLRCSATLI